MWREKVYRAALEKNIENEINTSLIYSGVYCILVGSTRCNVRNVDFFVVVAVVVVVETWRLGPLEKGFPSKH